MMHVRGQPEGLLVAEELQNIATQEMKSGALECTNPGQIRPGTWTRTRRRFCSVLSEGAGRRGYRIAGKKLVAGLTGAWRLGI